MFINTNLILDKFIPSLDRDFSLDPSEFKEMVNAIRQAEQALGKETLELTPKALLARNSRRSLFVVKDLNKGDILTRNNVKSLRPGNGLHPKYYDHIMGNTVNQDISEGTPLDLSMINDL